MKFLFSLLTVSLLLGTLHARPVVKAAKLYVSHFENVLGTSMELKVKAVSPRTASLAEEKVLAEIHRVSQLLSAYDVNSEFSRWMKTKNTPVAVSAELFEVLSLYDNWRDKTHGALDAAAQVVSKLWKQAAAEQTVPSNESLAKAVAAVRQKHWELNSVTRTATHTSDVPLILNSFTKSYIIARAADAAMKAGDIQSIVLNIGGDIVVRGNGEETIQVSNPKADAENDAPIDRISVHDRAVATSGNYRRGERINGKWYSHIVDPRTGQPAGEVISATVVASSATDAGALATSFNVLTPEESATLAATLPGVEYLLITRTGERIESKGWSALELPLEPAAPAAADEWNKGFELAINLELSLITGDRVAHRPFVAIWVEDKDKTVVRNISLWYNKPKWLKDLHEWYRINNEKFAADNTSFASVTSATRTPGKYVIKWDGKDASGTFVKPGTYTICIEVAREHGTYQIIRQEIECKKSPKLINLAGNVEIASASLDYRKKAAATE